MSLVWEKDTEIMTEKVMVFNYQMQSKVTARVYSNIEILFLRHHSTLLSPYKLPYNIALQQRAEIMTLS